MVLAGFYVLAGKRFDQNIDIFPEPVDDLVPLGEGRAAFELEDKAELIKPNRGSARSSSLVRPRPDQCPSLPPQSGSDPQTAGDCGGSHAACNSLVRSALEELLGALAAVRSHRTTKRF